MYQPGDAHREPWRGLFVFDNVEGRVRYFNGVTWDDLPDIPKREELRAFYGQSAVSPGNKYGAAGVTMFPFQGKLVVALLYKRPANRPITPMTMITERLGLTCVSGWTPAESI